MDLENQNKMTPEQSEVYTTVRDYYLGQYMRMFADDPNQSEKRMKQFTDFMESFEESILSGGDDE
jgi:hypothetical protein